MPRKLPKKSSSETDTSQPTVWEWESNSSWNRFCEKDCDLLEQAMKTATGSAILRFSFASNTEYEVDFKRLTQKNTETLKVRKIRKTETIPSWNGDSKIPDPPELSYDSKRCQINLGAQSKRMISAVNFGPQISAHIHATRCFQSMLQNEERYCGDWAVFYHSYSNPALIYEVQAAIAAVLFRFKSNFGTLPRLMRGCFAEIPDAPSMMSEFPKWPDQDHNPRFKSVGICATVSLLAYDAEAPPTSVFLSGYNVGVISRSIIHDMLTTCGVGAAQSAVLTTQLVALAERYGLHVGAFGGRPSASGCPGHLLQIFIRRHLVDKYAYASLPMGVPDKARHPLGTYLQAAGPLAGQARIVVHPSAFLRAAKVRANVFSADEAFHARRPAFQQELTALLAPILGAGAARERAARGVFGGRLPAWFEAEDQRRFVSGGPPPLPPAPPSAPPSAPPVTLGGRKRAAPRAKTAPAAAAAAAKRRR